MAGAPSALPRVKTRQLRNRIHRTTLRVVAGALTGVTSEYPKLPTSSPMMTTMLGFLSAAWAGALATKSAATAMSSDKPKLTSLCLMRELLVVGDSIGVGRTHMLIPRLVTLRLRRSATPRGLAL